VQLETVGRLAERETEVLLDTGKPKEFECRPRSTGITVPGPRFDEFVVLDVVVPWLVFDSRTPFHISEHL
jgi:hypothetical protein